MITGLLLIFMLVKAKMMSCKSYNYDEWCDAHKEKAACGDYTP